MNLILFLWDLFLFNVDIFYEKKWLDLNSQTVCPEYFNLGASLYMHKQIEIS